MRVTVHIGANGRSLQLKKGDTVAEAIKKMKKFHTVPRNRSIRKNGRTISGDSIEMIELKDGDKIEVVKNAGEQA